MKISFGRLVLALALGWSAIVVKVEGLACPFCVYGLEKQLKKIPGVAAARVDLGGSKAVITTRPGAKISDDQIRDAVRRAGFKASEIKSIGS